MLWPLPRGGKVGQIVKKRIELCSFEEGEITNSSVGSLQVQKGCKLYIGVTASDRPECCKGTRVAGPVW